MDGTRFEQDSGMHWDNTDAHWSIRRLLTGHNRISRFDTSPDSLEQFR